MYKAHFGLSDTPFSIAPNPQYLYMSQRHKEALAHLLYGVQSDGGFILLTGEVGTGKTTLCRCLLEQVPEGVETAFVLNPRVTAIELLATICDEFGIVYPANASLKQLVDQLNQFLLQSHADKKKAVLIIDEAQNLTPDVLEQLRLLTNLETNERKLLQIILLGQPELLEMLAQKNLRQLSQRITARFHLEALNKHETAQYIAHRMTVAEGNPKVFPPRAMSLIYRLSRGTPRLINLIADRALLGAYARDSETVTTAIVNKAAKEVLGKRFGNKRKTQAGLTAVSLAAVTCVAFIAWNLDLYQSQVKIEPPETTKPEAVVQPASTPAAPVLPAMKGHVNESDAYHELFALWGAAFADRSQPACHLAEKIGLQCLELDAGLAAIQALDRPAIIELSDQFFIISSIEGSNVTLFASDRQYTVPVTALDSALTGKTRLVWRMPPGYTGPSTTGDQGAAVDWLVVQLAVFEGKTPPLETGFIFDESLVSRLRHFQNTVGIEDTGITDPQTWVHLNSIEGISLPKLVEDNP